MATTPTALHHLIQGHPTPAEGTDEAVTVSDPTCPNCGSDLEMLRVEVREVSYPIRSVGVFHAGIGLMADVTVDDEATSNECIEVSSDSIVCTGTGCDFKVSGEDFAELIWA